MAAYLFVWNPKKWPWQSLDHGVDQLASTGRYSELWSCASHKSVRVGDRAFLMRLGAEPKGIMGSGYVATPPFPSRHWSGEDKLVPRVIIDFDMLLHPDREALLPLRMLEEGHMAVQTWTPQASGISISPAVVADLEAMWFRFVESRVQKSATVGRAGPPPGVFSEGAHSRVEITRYERNPHARRVCIEHHGLSCVICGFNFEQRYGELGSGFIHVHHIEPIAHAGEPRSVDPVEDLRPVCPNCHSMLHRKSPPYSVEELAEKYKSESR